MQVQMPLHLVPPHNHSPQHHSHHLLTLPLNPPNPPNLAEVVVGLEEKLRENPMILRGEGVGETDRDEQHLILVLESRLPSDPYFPSTFVPAALAGNLPFRLSSLSIFFSNITTWGPQAERYVSTLTDDIVCLAEHHQSADKLPKLSSKMRSFGRNCSSTAAAASGRSAAGTSAGLTIAYKASVQAYQCDNTAVCHACGVQDPLYARWHPIHLRLRNITITIMTLYLYTAEELTERNLSILEQVALFILSLSTPCIGRMSL